MYTSYDNSSLAKIAVLLKSHKPEYLSGQDISELLKISRAAVWKHIKKLRTLGYTIDSRSKRGYRLTKTTKLLLPWEVTDGLETKIVGKKIYYFETINSTQTFASELASKNEPEGTMIIAGKQTQGRGRMNRKWASPSGGIWFSVILRPNFELSAATLFPMVSSLALAIAIEKVLRVRSKIKWPNDLTLGGKKFAGILVDASVESGKIDHLIIGVGINFRINIAETKKDLKDSANFYGITTLLNKSNKANPAPLVQMFLLELERLYNLLAGGHSSNIIKEWTKKSSTIGKMITVASDDGQLYGKATQIDKDGALIVSRKGKNYRILVGDIR